MRHLDGLSDWENVILAVILICVLYLVHCQGGFDWLRMPQQQQVVVSQPPPAAAEGMYGTTANQIRFETAGDSTTATQWGQEGMGSNSGLEAPSFHATPYDPVEAKRDAQLNAHLAGAQGDAVMNASAGRSAEGMRGYSKVAMGRDGMAGKLESALYGGSVKL